MENNVVVLEAKKITYTREIQKVIKLLPDAGAAGYETINRIQATDDVNKVDNFYVQFFEYLKELNKKTLDRSKCAVAKNLRSPEKEEYQLAVATATKIMPEAIGLFGERLSDAQRVGGYEKMHLTMDSLLMPKNLQNNEWFSNLSEGNKMVYLKIFEQVNAKEIKNDSELNAALTNIYNLVDAGGINSVAELFDAINESTNEQNNPVEADVQATPKAESTASILTVCSKRSYSGDEAGGNAG